MFKFIKTFFGRKPKTEVQSTPKPWNWETDNPKAYKESKQLFDVVMADLHDFPPHLWGEFRGAFQHSQIPYILESFECMTDSGPSTRMGIKCDDVAIYLIQPLAEELFRRFRDERQDHIRKKSKEVRQKIIERLVDR
jgi:hypothetical protein